MNRRFLSTLITIAISTMSLAQATTLKIATFNVSMEALNYGAEQRDEGPDVSAKALNQALDTQHQQIKNIAEIIQRVNPDIILLNEFDNQDNTPNHQHVALKKFLSDYLSISQQKQKAITYPYYYQGPVNTGVNSGFDIDGNGTVGQLPADGFGYGHFPGHFSMVLLSKYPINFHEIRTFQYFKWKDMPGALRPVNPENNTPWFSEEAWHNLRLSSKSHWDIPVNVNNETIHILASHPTPPVFDGPEDRNGKRNHDEIRFWSDYISPEKSGYIYDDSGNTGGLKAMSRFVIVGDLNASVSDGSAIKAGIHRLLLDDKIQDSKPQSQGASQHSQGKPNAKHHTAFWRMRADYVLPSKAGFTVKNSGVFWPTKNDETYRLIQDRKASSDHRLVWLELETSQLSKSKLSKSKLSTSKPSTTQSATGE